MVMAAQWGMIIEPNTRSFNADTMAVAGVSDRIFRLFARAGMGKRRAIFVIRLSTMDNDLLVWLKWLMSGNRLMKSLIIKINLFLTDRRGQSRASILRRIK